MTDEPKSWRGLMTSSGNEDPGPVERLIAAHTDLERRVISASAEVMRSFLELERVEGASHPSHARDVARAVHDVQRVVAMRLARRVDPGAWDWKSQ